jgi:hypothetical protein
LIFRFEIRARAPARVQVPGGLSSGRSFSTRRMRPLVSLSRASISALGGIWP